VSRTHSTVHCFGLILPSTLSSNRIQFFVFFLHDPETFPWRCYFSISKPTYIDTTHSIIHPRTHCLSILHLKKLLETLRPFPILNHPSRCPNPPTLPKYFSWPCSLDLTWVLPILPLFFWIPQILNFYNSKKKKKSFLWSRSIKLLYKLTTPYLWVVERSRRSVGAKSNGSIGKDKRGTGKTLLCAG
jgi:hypothetical protein